MIVVVAISLAGAASARAASVFGTVTDVVTHAGVASFEVCAYKALASQAEAELMPESMFCTPPETEAEAPGEYILGGIPIGQYKVAFLPAAGSKYAPEFYDDVRTWGEAEVLDVPTGTPIDAALEEVPPSEEEGEPSEEAAAPTSSESPSPPGAQPAAPVALPTLGAAKRPPLRCRHGFKKKRVRGKLRCVRARPTRRHRQAGGRRLNRR